MYKRSDEPDHMNLNRTPVPTIPGRPTSRELAIGLGILIIAGVGSIWAGPGFGLLVVTLALIAGALWLAYATAPSVEGTATRSPAAPKIDGPQISGSMPRSISLPSVRMPTISHDRATITSLGFLSALGSILAIVFAGGFVFLKNRDLDPPGFFADEAAIGVESWKLIYLQADTTPIPFFYHHLEYNHLGTLPLFSTAPFVALFGLTTHAVRGATVFWMIAAGIAIYFTLRRLKVPYAAVPVLAMMMSPLVILVGRTNFGHAVSLFAMSLGFLVWTIARDRTRTGLAILAGVLIGLAAYGQPSYYIAVPVFLVAIGLVEIAYNRLDWASYQSLLWMGIGAVVTLLPIPYRALTYDPFLDRYRDKTEGAVHGLDRLTSALRHYPEYFGYDMLFVHGTTGWQTRHSIPGAPWFYTSMLIFLLIGLASLVLVKGDVSKRFFWPMALALLFYPIPDLASRPAGENPYSYSLVWGVIGIPFVAGYGLIGARKLVKRFAYSRPALVYASVMVLVTLVSLVGFWRGPFADYPNVAADYWGWQYGPGPITDYFKAHPDDYDEYFLSGDFNAAYILEEFYMHGSSIADRTSTGGLDMIDLNKSQLFSVRVSEWDGVRGSQFPDRSYLRLVDTIFYPDGSPAFYLMTVDPTLIDANGQKTEIPVG